MKTIRKIREESWLHDPSADVAVPIEITLRGDTLTVEYYPSAEKIICEILQLFGKNGDILFSSDAVGLIAQRCGSFLSRYGFSLSPDSEEYYLGYIFCETEIGVVPEIRRLSGDEEYNDLTGTDIAGLCEAGYIVYAAVVGDTIAAVSNTGEPVGSDAGREIEIGVDTAERYRCRGYGKACAAALVRELSSMGHTAVYECASGNTASIRLAESIGGRLTYKKIYAVGFRDE